MIREVGFDTDANIDLQTFERLIVEDFVTNTSPVKVGNPVA